MSILCEAWWGSHACDLEPGHSGPHRCCADGEPCSEYDATTGRARYWEEDYLERQSGWSEWLERR